MILFLCFVLGAAAVARSDGSPEPPEPSAPDRSRYLWPNAPIGDSLAERIPPPPGFMRRAAPQTSFTTWLRGLPLLPGRPSVRLHDGA